MTTDQTPMKSDRSAVIDQDDRRKILGESSLINEIAGMSKALAATIIENCTTTLPLVKTPHSDSRPVMCRKAGPTSMGL